MGWVLLHLWLADVAMVGTVMCRDYGVMILWGLMVMANLGFAVAHTWWELREKEDWER